MNGYEMKQWRLDEEDKDRGIGPKRSNGVAGSYDADNRVLTIVTYNQQPAPNGYVNSMWEHQQEPYSGDVINSYHDGAPEPGAAPLGPFYELETSSTRQPPTWADDATSAANHAFPRRRSRLGRRCFKGVGRESRYDQGAILRMLRTLAVILAGGCFANTVAAAVAKPNIVFVMADDLGPGWVDWDGSNPEINTPNLERLARDGMVFNRAYAAASVCSPTRAACITGMSPAQIHLTTHIPGVAGRRHPAPKGGPEDAESIEHLPLELPSYARELRKLGYATAFLGKWHLAGEGSVKTNNGIVDSRYHPEHFGFDSNLGGCAFGQPKSWFDPYRNGTIPNRRKGEYLTDRLGDEAASYIRNQKDGPFHLALWFYSVHTPLRAPKPLVKKNNGNAYLAMLESMDTAVGKVLDALEATSKLDHTLVVFYSDNGGDRPTQWLAEKKGSLLEGGLRVPMVVSWPGVIEGGTQTDEPVSSMDFFPTFVHAAGGSTTSIKQLEGLDLLPLFQGAGQLDRDALYWHYPHNRTGVKYNMGSVILSRDWKFYQGYGAVGDALFNLKSDPMETTNRLAQRPDLADRLRARLARWLAAVNASMPPVVKN